MKPRIYDRKGMLAIHPRAFFDLFFEPPTRENDAAGDVAVVSIRGPLEHHSGWWCDSYDAILERVDLACAGPAKAIVLSIDSPGGECAGCFEAARAIREKCAAAGKRVVSYVDGSAFSAAYALACAGEEIVLGESSLCGSIGVIAQRLDWSAMNQARGIRVELVTSGKHKADGHPDNPVSDAELLETQRVVDSLASSFFDLVAEMRGTDVTAIAALEAGVFHGADAIARGLADRVASFDQLLAMVASGEELAGASAGDDMSEEEKARAALQAIIDDEESDEKAKARATKALAAMDDSEESDDDDEEEESAESDEEEPEASAAKPGATVSAKTAAELAGAGVDLEKRLRALEKSTEARERDALIASHGGVTPKMSAILKKKPLAEVRELLAGIEPKRKPKLGDHAAAAQVAGTRGDQQGADRADQQGPEAAAAMDRAMGLTSTKRGVVRDGVTLYLGAPVPVTKEAAATK